MLKTFLLVATIWSGDQYVLDSGLTIDDCENAIVDVDLVRTSEIAGADLSNATLTCEEE